MSIKNYMNQPVEPKRLNEFNKFRATESSFWFLFFCGKILFHKILIEGEENLYLMMISCSSKRKKNKLINYN